MLHLSGRDHVATDATAIAVYASMPRPAALPPLDRTIATNHVSAAAVTVKVSRSRTRLAMKPFSPGTASSGKVPMG